MCRTKKPGSVRADADHSDVPGCLCLLCRKAKSILLTLFLFGQEVESVSNEQLESCFIPVATDAASASCSGTLQRATTGKLTEEDDDAEQYGHQRAGGEAV